MHHTGPHRTSLHYKLVSKSELTMCFRHFSNKLLQKLSKTFLKFFKKSSKILKNFLKMSKALSLQKKIGNDRTDRQTDRQTHIFRTKFSKRRASRQILRTLGQLEITHPKRRGVASQHITQPQCEIKSLRDRLQKLHRHTM